MSFSPSVLFRAGNRIPRKSTNLCSKHNSFCQTNRYRGHSSSQLFGSKVDTPGSPPGEIIIENVQDVLPNLDHDRLRTTVEKIRDMIGYPTYDVTLYLVEDQLMQETNRDTRGMDKPTDILSFQFHLHEEAGVLQAPDFDIPDYYTLGEMLIDIPYVMRQCQEDQELVNISSNAEEDEYEDRGVSGAMATVYDPEQRINMLLVHGMLHLVGHDHEEDDEFELMVSKEEEILGILGMLPTKDY